MARHPDDTVKSDREQVLEDLDPRDQQRAEHLRATDHYAFRRLLDALHARRKAEAAVKRLTPHRLLELVRRDSGYGPEPDGFGAGGGSEGGRSADPTSTTERAALDDGQADPTGVILSNMLAEVAEFGGQAKRLADLDDLVTAVAAVKPPSMTSGAGDCGVCDAHCDGVDGNRRRSGLCPRHYFQWNRAHAGDLKLTLGDWQREARARWAKEQEAEKAKQYDHEAMAG